MTFPKKDDQCRYQDALLSVGAILEIRNLHWTGAPTMVYYGLGAPGSTECSFMSSFPWKRKSFGLNTWEIAEDYVFLVYARRMALLSVSFRQDNASAIATIWYPGYSKVPESRRLFIGRLHVSIEECEDALEELVQRNRCGDFLLNIRYIRLSVMGIMVNVVILVTMILMIKGSYWTWSLSCERLNDRVDIVMMIWFSIIGNKFFAFQQLIS